MKRALLWYVAGSAAALLFYGTVFLVPGYGPIMLVNYGFLTCGLLAALLYRATHKPWIFVFLPFLGLLVYEHCDPVYQRVKKRESGKQAGRLGTAASAGHGVSSPAVYPEMGFVSPAVQVFASLSDAVPAAARRARLAEFPDPLSGAEAAALADFLSAPESRIPGVAPRDALALKNDAADVLTARAPDGAGLAAFFAAQSLDSRNSHGWRDYALQALPGACLRDRSPATLRTAGDAYAAVFSEPRLRRFRGTALNGLASLERAGVRAGGLSAEDAALAVLRDPQPDENPVLTAAALCRERGWTNAVPELRRLAASSPSPLVRRAADSALRALAATNADDRLSAALPRPMETD